MPLPAVPVLIALWAAKTGGTYYGYKKLKEKNPKLVEKWEDKAKEVKDQAKDLLFGSDGGETSVDDSTQDTSEQEKPNEPDL